MHWSKDVTIFSNNVVLMRSKRRLLAASILCQEMSFLLAYRKSRRAKERVDDDLRNLLNRLQMGDAKYILRDMVKIMKNDVIKCKEYFEKQPF